METKTMKRKHFIAVMLGFLLCLWSGNEAVAQFGGGGGGGGGGGADFSVTQVSPASGSDVLMGDTVPFVFQIRNLNSSSGDRINEVRFRLPSPGSTFSSTTAAPTGWTKSASSASSVTFQANSWSNTIRGGNTLNFTLILVIRKTDRDVTETLDDVRARFSDGDGGGGWGGGGWGGSDATQTIDNPGSWRIKALKVAFQITDTSGNPITAIHSGGTVRLIMTVTNRSTVTQSSIVTNPNPPTRNQSNATATHASTQYSPSPLTLPSGATGTITFTYTVSLSGSATNGSVSFSANARNSSGNATSTSTTSIALAVSNFTASMTVTPTCAYIGQDITVTMTLKNSFSTGNITNVTPTLTLTGAPVTKISGPTPAAPNGPVAAGGGTFVFSWTYRATGGNAGDTIGFAGTASGTRSSSTINTPANPPPATVVLGAYSVTMAPTETNASSKNQAVTWTFVNEGCAAVNSVSIAYPAGWSYGGDAYSLVENSADNFIETWSASVANPVVFTAPSAAARLMLGGTGAFRLVFTGTPPTTGASSFTLTITDANGGADTRVVPITVNAFNSDGLNNANTKSHREEFR